MNDYLFSKQYLSDFVQVREKEIFSEIDKYEPNYLLNVSVEDLSIYFEEKYGLKVPFLKEGVTSSYKECSIDVSQDRSFVHKPSYAPGLEITCSIPFEGDSELFYWYPNHGQPFHKPVGTINQSEITIYFRTTNHNSTALKKEFDKNLELIKHYLLLVENDIKPFNNSIHQKASQYIEKRREKILKDRQLVASIGFPIKERTNAPLTYAIPNVRRKPSFQRPIANAASYSPEPTLEMKEYEHILKIISNMVLVIERSPKAFAKMGEEDLRQHFLVQLNGQYEGQATGETFNFNGKTDILIRDDKGKNVFVAECKFWKGSKGLEDTIDQLLSYVTWRDTKTAILLFNQNKDFSSVLKQIPEVVKEHPNYKRAIEEYKNESGFRFILHHKDDKNREIFLTILAFVIPKYTQGE